MASPNNPVRSGEGRQQLCTCRFSVVAAGQAGLIVLLAAFLGIGSALIRPDGIALIGNWVDGAASVSDTETISRHDARAHHEEERA